MIYLFKNGMDSGESFHTWDEVWDWFHEALGTHPDPVTKRLAVTGRSVQLAGDWLSFIVEDAAEVAVAA